MKITEIDTPALLIDREIVLKNLDKMQKYADKFNVSLRPHTKTHKMPYFAKLQVECGANGITVAKVGEAEVMAKEGLSDIFIANEIVTRQKFARIIALLKYGAKVSFGVDSVGILRFIDEVFGEAGEIARLLVEIEVGENRSGVIEEGDFRALMSAFKECKNAEFCGVFSHDGHSYKAKDKRECEQIFKVATKRTLKFADIAREFGYENFTVSIGSTPSLINDFEIPKGVTELRPGTYIFMDASQANAYGSFDMNAASVLSVVISRPTATRTILDAGAKALTKERRSEGFCTTPGMGLIAEHEVWIDSLFDEHAIILNEKFAKSVRVGDLVRIYPNHICPVVNLYDYAYLVSGDEVCEKVPVLARGKIE